MTTNLKTGFCEEARLKEYRFYDGAYWDFIIYAMKREDFFRRYEKLLGSFEKMVSDQNVVYEN